MNGKEIHEKVSKGYFPFTDQCPAGEKCTGKECHFFIGEGRCWMREFNDIPYKILNTEYPGQDFFRFSKDSSDYLNGLDHIHIQMPHGTYSDDFRKTGNIVVDVWIQFNSFRLANKVKEKFQLKDWTIEGHNWEGGDDHVLQITIPGQYEKKNEIIEFFKKLKKLIPEILAFEKEINICQVCQKHSSTLEEYASSADDSGKRFAICHPCEIKIIADHIKDHIKKGSRT